MLIKVESRISLYIVFKNSYSYKSTYIPIVYKRLFMHEVMITSMRTVSGNVINFKCSIKSNQ